MALLPGDIDHRAGAVLLRPRASTWRTRPSGAAAGWGRRCRAGFAPLGSISSPGSWWSCCLGFASGLPLLLTLSTLTFWLAEAKVDKAAIGLFALVGLPYTWKFVWSPIIDRVPLPLVHRRCSAAGAAGCCSSSCCWPRRSWRSGRCDPAEDLGRMALLARAGGLPVREPGHRHRRLPGRAARGAPAGCRCRGGGHRLSRRHAAGRCRGAGHRRVRRLVLGLCRHGRLPRGRHGDRPAGPRAAKRRALAPARPASRPHG